MYSQIYTLLQTFLNPTPEINDFFGNRISISGDNVLVGAGPDNTSAINAGAAYLFNAISGTLLQTFLNPTPEAFDQFGSSVSISGNNVLVGANGDNTGATGAGAAYLLNATNTSTFVISIPDTAINNMTVPLTVLPGNYSVTETVPSGWTLDASDCEKNGNSVECIFENTFVIPSLPPTIKITKNATNADGAFSFTIFNATNPTNSTLVSIPNTAINNMTTPLTVIPGNYSVTEIVPAGWTLDASDCEKKLGITRYHTKL